MSDEPGLAGARRHLAGEVAHWRAAAQALGDLETLAGPGAWAGLERYLNVQIRARLEGIARSLAAEGDRLAAAVAGAANRSELAQVRKDALQFRRRYLRAETVINFYGEAVNTRTTHRLGTLLRGLDALAVDSMEVVLRPLNIDVPPVLTYLDKGLGASILRAGVRLWDSGALSPAAAIKVTRHNLLRPTSIVHECGHQVAHLCDWNRELAAALEQAMAPFSPEAAAAWRSWASEVGADVYAFCVLGYAPVPPLANVVDGSSDEVFALLLGDPHPFAWLRVMFNVALCRSWYGGGPWDDLAEAWRERHPVERAAPAARQIVLASVEQLGRLADVCTRQPMRAFRNQPLSKLADPRRVSTQELAGLAERAGTSLWTSTYLQRHESTRILAWNGLEAALSPERAPEFARQLESWLQSLGTEPLSATA